MVPEPTLRPQGIQSYAILCWVSGKIGNLSWSLRWRSIVPKVSSKIFSFNSFLVFFYSQEQEGLKRLDSLVAEMVDPVDARTNSETPRNSKLFP